MAKYCGHCGAKMEDDAKFCGMCGYTFQDARTGPPRTKGKSGTPKMLAVIALTYVLMVIIGCLKFGSADKNSKQNDNLFEYMSNSNDIGVTIGDLDKGEGVEILYPNFEELSVGRAYNSEGKVYEFLFNKNGVIQYTSENKHRILSGFYDGMCFISPDSMMDENGSIFKPDFLSEEEKIVRYARDALGTILWTVKKEDTLDGSVATLTAWSTDGSVLFQGNTTQDPFSRVSPSSLYEDLIEGCTWDSNVIGYCGGPIYRIKRFTDFFFINLQTQEVSHVQDASGGSGASSSGELVVRSSGAGTMHYVELYDTDGNLIPQSENMVSHRYGVPIFQEGLIYLDAFINNASGKDIPAGFYDANLNQTIDLSQYNVYTVYEMEPRFINGYAVLQMKNSDGIPFWGVLNKDGTWNFEPKRGTAWGVLPLGDGLLINVETDEESKEYHTFNERGENLGNDWDGIRIGGGYEKAPFESFEGYLYTNILDSNWNSKIARIGMDGSIEYLT